MLKKFLSIFKRDKAGYSSEELEWQRKIGKVIIIILCAILVISNLVIVFLLFDKVCNFLKGITLNTNTVIILFIALDILAVILVSATPILIINGWAVISQEIDAQLKRNLEEKQRREVLSRVKKKDYSKLVIQPFMINEIFWLIVADKIEMESFDNNTIRVSLPDADVKPLSIKYENLLAYFQIRDER